LTKKIITFSDAINRSLIRSMRVNSKVINFGLGINDPKSIFGTTKNLLKYFGNKRVFDTPTSENALTGVGIGLSLGGYIPVMTHQRLDFFLLAMDQLVNVAAKYFYMYGGNFSIPITIRLITGRGWGQGPTHSQNLHSIFAHIPGLKVVMPSTTQDAYQLLLASIFDPNPVIFIESRWLHNTKGALNFEKKIEKIGKAKILKKGQELTIVAMSYLTIEALKVCNKLDYFFGIKIEIVDLRSVRPIDYNTICNSLKKTKRLLVLDTGTPFCSIASEIISHISINKPNLLKSKPEKINMPDLPVPSSYFLTKNFYPSEEQIVKKIFSILKIKKKINFKKQIYHDIPDESFQGPF
jgi:acetoin:2,6-dichlorophenolindophenol oxidoreductase subunit beta